MNYLDVKAKVSTMLMKKKVTMTIMVMLLIATLLGVNTLSTVLVTGNSILDYLLSFLFGIVGLMISNLVYFCFLKHAREEAFDVSIIRFSLSHLPIQIVMAITYTLIRFFIQLALTLLGMFLPFLFIPINLCLVILFMGAECTIAYSIYDKGINVMEMTKGVFQFVKAKWRIILRSGLPYLLSYFAYVVCIVMVIGGSIQMNGEALDVMKTVEYIASDPMSGTVLSILGLTFVFWIILAYFELRIFLSTAIVYDENQPLFFSRIKVKNAR